MGGRASTGTRNTGSAPDFSQGYANVGKVLREQYSSVEELRDAGFVAVNDFSLSSLLKETNEIASDNQPWKNRSLYYVWDPDWKRWVKAAERRY